MPPTTTYVPPADDALLASDPALRPPRANVRAAGVFDPNQFLAVPNVPILAEHQTVGRNGRQLSFGFHELRAVANRCNARIRDTGDYAAVTLGHTPTEEEKANGAPMPPMVGFAGPFRLGVLGEPGARQRWAILADLHIYRQDADCLRHYPRRSPELWLEDSYEHMFLDPIALLGAEAPRLDMGLLYSAWREGREIERYAAASPAPASVFVPAHVGPARPRKPRRYQSSGDPAMNFSDDQLRQLIGAFEQLDWVQWVKQQMAQAPAGTPAEPPPPAAGPPAAPPPAPPAAPPGLETPPAPAAAPPSEPPPAPPADAEKEKLQRRYQADDSDDEDLDDLFAEDAPPAGSGDDADDEQEAKKYAASRSRYARHVERQLQRLKAELVEARQQIAAERGHRVEAERYAKLSDLAGRYEFDLDVERQRYARASIAEDAFAAHLASIEANYRPREAGFDVHLPVGPDPARPGKPAAERYSKAQRDAAMVLCEQAAVDGRYLDYAEAIERVARGEK